jgi:ribosomal protein L40E
MTINLDKAVTKTVSGAKIAAGKAAETANIVIEYTKTQIDRAAIRDKIRDLYLELGKLYYVDMGGSDNRDEMRECKIKLDELFVALKKTDSAQKCAPKKVSKKIDCKICDFCSAANPLDNVYCSKCGEKL